MYRRVERSSRRLQRSACRRLELDAQCIQSKWNFASGQPFFELFAPGSVNEFDQHLAFVHVHEHRAPREHLFSGIAIQPPGELFSSLTSQASVMR